MQNYGEPEIIPINFSMALAENPAAQHFFACLSPEDKAGFINVVASAPDEETMTQQLARAIDLLQKENRDYYSL